ncbi:MAG: permease-like cell division protein FtsX [bacterium]
MFKKAQVGYLVQEALAGFHRRKLTTGVTVLIMGSALLVLALFTLVTLNLGSLLSSAHSGIDLRAFLLTEPGLEQQAELQGRLLAIPGVESVVYISKEQALNEFSRELGDDAELLTSLDENPLPASFHVTLLPEARNAATVGAISEEIALWSEIDDIVYSQAWVEVLEQWAFVFRMASLAVGLVVFIAAVFVISNTVKLTVAASARIIEVMKQVGATNTFIRTPFLWEGMLEGLLGGIVAMSILGGTYSFLAPQIEGLIFFTPMQIAGFITFCVVLGFLGSWAALRKYLRL